MKTRYIALSFLFLSIALTSFSMPALQTDTIRVYGNCGMCKNRIEKAATEAGAATANWDEDTKLMVISYDASKASSRKIQEKIAAAGHDTQDVVAPEASYSKLPGCCKYERKASKGAQAQSKAGCCAGSDCAKTSDCCADNATAAVNCCQHETCKQSS